MYEELTTLLKRKAELKEEIEKRINLAFKDDERMKGILLKALSGERKYFWQVRKYKKKYYALIYYDINEKGEREKKWKYLKTRIAGLVKEAREMIKEYNELDKEIIKEGLKLASIPKTVRKEENIKTTDELLLKYVKQLDELIEGLRKEAIMVGAGAYVINPKMVRVLLETYETAVRVMEVIRGIGVEEMSEELKKKKEELDKIWEEMRKLKMKGEMSVKQ